MYRTDAAISMQELVGKGYADFWKCRTRYRVVKGSRASKKSKTAALWYIYHLMRYPGSNLLVVRKTAASLKDSCFTELKWAVKRLEVSHLWHFTENPLQATYIPTGQRIYFRGLDDPLKITSITVSTGALCWLWIEEAYEISRESDFDILDESIRGDVPENLWKQTTLTFNPWNEHHWLKARFFDNPSSDVLAMTTNYMCNEWLDDKDQQLFDDMQLRNPRRYRTAALGDWGISEGLIYENWAQEKFDIDRVRSLDTVCGLDFGYTIDPSAFFIAFIDETNRRLFVWDEIYKKGLSNKQLYIEIKNKGYAKENIVADSAEPKSIDELRSLGLRIRPALKGRDSITHGIQYAQNFELIVHPRCKNFIAELSNYAWDTDRFGRIENAPKDEFNHLMDAMRYALERYSRKTTVRLFTGGI